MFFSESRYADDEPSKGHRGPIFGMVGTQTFGAGDSFDSIPNIGPQAPLKIIAAFRKKHGVCQCVNYFWGGIFVAIFA
jgi:hypothetical protein